MNARLALAVIWAFTVAVPLRLFSVWDRLPQRVAVHFGIGMQPNGWLGKSAMAALMVLLMVGHAALSTWLVASGRGGGMVAPIQMAVSAVFFSVDWQVVRFNTAGRPLQAIWIILPVLLVAGLIFAGASARHAAH